MNKQQVETLISVIFTAQISNYKHDLKIILSEFNGSEYGNASVIFEEWSGVVQDVETFNHNVAKGFIQPRSLISRIGNTPSGIQILDEIDVTLDVLYESLCE